jgi:Predicted transcriptional regulators
MFNENLIACRKAKGFSQEELAIRLSVVRQTISKWEKGLSVPDADLLIRISEIFEVSVSDLLGSKIEDEGNHNTIADQLSRINEQLAIKNSRSRWVMKVIKVILIIIVVLIVLTIILVALFGINPNSSELSRLVTTFL